MFNECATSRQCGHWSLLPRRATEPIAASLILNIAISERLLMNISRKFGPRSGPTKSLKLIKSDGFPDFFYHTFESTCKYKGADGTARAFRVVPVFNKVVVLAALNII